MDQIDLFCIPYAGGSAHAIYSKWIARLDPMIKVKPLELAGHGRRISEPFYSSVQTAVNDLLKAIEPHIMERPYALYGHSMGTVLAYELARKLRFAGLPQPRVLFLSGRQPPHNTYQGKAMHKMSDEEFLENIKGIGGTPSLLFESKELLRVFLPILRSDYRIIEQYRVEEPLIAIDTEIVFFYSDQDDLVTKPGIFEWKQYTTQSFEHYEFQGDHFFINEAWQDLCRIINQKLAKCMIQDNTR